LVLCATVHKNFAKYWTTVRRYNDEMDFGPTLQKAAYDALVRFNREPVNVIVYRYAGSQRQKTTAKLIEVKAFLNAFNDKKYTTTPELIYISLNRDLTTKFCTVEKRQNPDPGTIVDSKITGTNDFYLISSRPREGMSIPMHYEILAYYAKDKQGKYDLANVTPVLLRKIEELSYKLSFLYYNALGPCKAPAILHYANKLAEWVGKICEKESLPRQELMEREKSLFFI